MLIAYKPELTSVLIREHVHIVYKPEVTSVLIRGHVLIAYKPELTSVNLYVCSLCLVNPQTIWFVDASDCFQIFGKGFKLL